MKKFTKLNSIAAPILQNNIDTDVIIPMHRYVVAKKSEIHKFAFEPLRYLTNGEKNLEFSLNQTRFANSEILVVGKNFGCGSSREAAVWAIAGLGIKCIIGQSFGNIFHSNCFENGILVITFSEEIITLLWDITYFYPGLPKFSIDLIKKCVEGPENKTWGFEIEDHRRCQLLDGLDSISMTLKRKEKIEEFKLNDKSNRPWVYI